MANGLVFYSGVPGPDLVDWVLRLVHPHERGSVARGQGSADWHPDIVGMRVRVGIPRGVDSGGHDESRREPHDWVCVWAAHGADLLRRAGQEGRTGVHGPHHRDPISHRAEFDHGSVATGVGVFARRRTALVQVLSLRHPQRGLPAGQRDHRTNHRVDCVWAAVSDQLRRSAGAVLAVRGE